ncbi:MAG TPA: ATP synthase F1 subunit delta [Prolixibacteraceae bacterium]|nr:ATP synthase F1 subunit delta [Prolixibacteraceae bacterium]
MDQSKINVRYAKAFFSLAQEKGLMAALQQDVQTVSAVCASSADFNRLIDSPVISTSGKVKAIKSIFQDKVNALTLNFLALITQNRREKHMPSIFRDLSDMYRKSLGISSAVLTTARELDASLVEQIRKELETLSGNKVELSQQIDPQLIGGFVLRVDDKQYDASVSTQLKRIKESLLHTELKND